MINQTPSKLKFLFCFLKGTVNKKKATDWDGGNIYTHKYTCPESELL